MTTGSSHLRTTQSICQGVQSISLSAGGVVYQSICQDVQVSTGASQRREWTSTMPSALCAKLSPLCLFSENKQTETAGQPWLLATSNFQPCNLSVKGCSPCASLSVHFAGCASRYHCVKSLRSSYTGLHSQNTGCSQRLEWTSAMPSALCSK